MGIPEIVLTGSLVNPARASGPNPPSISWKTALPFVVFLAMIPIPPIGARENPEGAVGFSEDRCPTEAPPSYEIMTGYSQGDNPAEAIREARIDAERRWVDHLCGADDALCDGVRSHLRDWKEGDYLPASGAACATVAIPDSALTTFLQSGARLDADFDRLAKEIADVSLPLVRHADPVWGNHCAGGDLGRYLKALLEVRLGRHGVRLDDGPFPSVGAAGLQLHLTSRQDTVQVTALLRLQDERGAIRLEGATFPTHLFDLDTTRPGRCFSIQGLGLESGPRPGQDGLTVQVEVPGSSNTFCEGSTLAPVIYVDRPARIQVFNVLHDGTAHLLWPFEGAGLVDRELSLDMLQLRLLHDPESGDETLIAIAVPPDGSFGLTDPWLGYCATGTPFGSQSIPPAASIDYVTYTVLPQSKRCPPADVGEPVKRFSEAPPCEQ